MFSMADIALYFPYVALPDDAWVKAAALHWTQLGRVVPRGYYGIRDSDTVKRLRDELDFVVNVRPGHDGLAWVDEEVPNRINRTHFEWSRSWLSTDEAVDALFYDFLDTHQEKLRPRYGIEALGLTPLDTWDVYDELIPLDPRLQEVHPGKMTRGLAQHLAEAGLLFRQRYRWRRADDGQVLSVGDLAMHARLAGVFLAVVADVVARENNMSPVTDQPLLAAATSGWTVEALARILLEDEPAEAPEDYSQAFAVIALQTVLPRNLSVVPVDRIIEARKRLLPELMAYRTYLDSLVPDFVAISALPDPEVRAAKLRNHVEREIAQPIDRMERELGRLGLEPVRAVLTLQTLVPPAALGVLGDAVHLPPALTGAGVVAGCLVGAANSALDRRKQALASHPAGYLLHLRHELKPSDTVANIRAGIRRAVPRKPS